MIEIQEYNETYCRVLINDEALERELRDRFTFEVPGAKFTPLFKQKRWDGKIRLFNSSKKLIYKGLWKEVENFAYENDVEVKNGLSLKNQILSDTEITEHMKKVFNLNKFEVRDYQVDALKKCIENKRLTLLSPTSSGKSSIIYNLVRYLDRKTLIIVPSVGLLDQMKNDFSDYASADDDWDVENEVTTIEAGVDKTKTNQIVITTWQSAIKTIKTDWLAQFDVIITDEVHHAKSDSIRKILELCTKCEYRYGFTGTLDGIETNELVITGLFGPVHVVTRTHELIKSNHVAEIKIQCIQLLYGKESRRLKMDYQQEISFIVSHERRLKLLTKLALSLKGNTLILFRRVEDHGEKIKDLLERLKSSDHEIHFISGKIKKDVRNEIRVDMDKRDMRKILVASEGTTSTGISIKELDNVIFASPTKSKIKVLQSLGRGLRKSETKKSVTLYDISDDLTTARGKRNYTMNHFIERLKIYTLEKFPYKINKVELEPQ